MKYILPLISSLLILGCSDSTPAKAPEASQQITTQSTSPALEANESSTEAASAPEPVAAATPAPAAPAPTPAPVSTVTPAATASIDGGTLFGQKCSACHGSKAEKSALGKSQIIAGWKEDQVKNALKGYQDGSYGKEMKAVMQGQAKALSDAQIDALAKYISTL
ncbi:MAG: c-type cytochrome [Sulfuricurvum sp.]|uniref:c-type cytochrome n=1 Tax=Sulfuricurvum sp. TaxID=2025608 RepID=UPI0026124952|nr:c-type cytochrome [Sulfuricurvum sp.]MDD2369342.1 c-type cytochrome [Sulfuricurvum sp.]MDD2950518.1 c-type cytochrome [Sulfuricurvum sp.]MDD5118189.1 c-type cytochrome [Sulfuricurvum sp.]